MTPDDIAEQRRVEWWADAWWCTSCDRPNYVGAPEDECTNCGAIA